MNWTMAHEYWFLALIVVVLFIIWGSGADE